MPKKMTVHFTDKDIKYYEYLEANRGRKSQSVFVIELIEELMKKDKTGEL